MLYDNHGRKINYLRLAVTDRCNLRCFYCMPEEGIQYVPRTALLSYEEMERLLQLLAPLGIEKVRITGGEPFLRKGMPDFLARIAQIKGIQQLNITTNGTLTANLVSKLPEIGVSSVNLSLDSFDEKRFFEITRRDVFPQVMETFHQLLAYKIPTKINAVVMAGKNIEDIIPLVELSRTHPVSIRFIEEMPFNGKGSNGKHFVWNYKKILQHIQGVFPDLKKIPDPPHATALNYRVPGFKGSIGIIAAYSRLFCGSCNRIRLTPQGMLKTCLYDAGVFNLRDLMRSGATDEQLSTAFVQALGNRAKDGFESERVRGPVRESMATIGG